MGMTLRRYTLAGRRKHLFDTYTDRMLKRRGQDDRYEPDKTKAHLTWLAEQMSERAQSVYHIENMQPNWLRSRWKRVQYAVGVRLIGTLASMGYFAVFYMIMLILLGLLAGFVDFGDILSAVLASVIGGVVVGGVVGLILTTIAFFFRRKIRPVEALRWSGRRAVVGALIFGVSFALISATFFNFFATLTYTEEVATFSTPRTFNFDPDIGEFTSVTITRFDGTEVEIPWDDEFGSLNEQYNAIRAVEDPLYRANFFALFESLFLENALNFIMIGFMTGAISGAVIGGFTGKAIDLKTLPNQGIRQSWKNFIRIGLAYSVLTLVSFAGAVAIFVPSEILTLVLQNRTTGWLGMTLIVGLVIPSIGLLVALSRGGYAVVQHSTLRFFLWREKSTLRNISRFMDYSSEHLLTRKVGGGYIFIHRMLLEHFANSEKAKRQIEADSIDDYEPLTYRLEDKPLDKMAGHSDYLDESGEPQQQQQ